MTLNSYDISVVLLCSLALFGLYAIDTPHPAAMSVVTLGYVVVRQSMAMDRYYASLQLYSSTITAQRKRIIALEEELKEAHND